MVEERRHHNGFAPRLVSESVGRSLPHDLDAEEYLLSSCLLDGADVIARAREAGIRSDWFYDQKHGIIFTCLCMLLEAGEPTEIANVATELKATRQLEEIGGIPFLTQVSRRIPTTGQASYFINKVRQQALLRDVIRGATGAVEDCYNFCGGDIDDFIVSIQRRMQFSDHGGKRNAIKARSLASFEVPPLADPSILLGHRYLNKGDGAIISSTSGMGKTSFTLQGAATWSLGRAFLGIKPSRPLRSLIVQAEDSDGDIAEVWAGIKHGLTLSAEDEKVVAETVVVVTDRVHRGDGFIAALRGWIAKHKPDLVWINPLLAFCGGDITEASDAGKFLREGLNGLNEPPSFAYILIHHTTKPATGKARSDRRWNEVMYDLSGSAELTNWARAVMSLRPTETEGEFNLVLAKRGRRAGVVNDIPHGAAFRHEIITKIPLRHARGKISLPGRPDQIPLIFWEPREPDAPAARTEPHKGGRPREHAFAHFVSVFPTDPKMGLGYNVLHRAANDVKPVGKNAFTTLLEEAVGAGLVARDDSDPERPRYYRVISPSSS